MNLNSDPRIPLPPNDQAIILKIIHFAIPLNDVTHWKQKVVMATFQPCSVQAFLPFKGLMVFRDPTTPMISVTIQASPVKFYTVIDYLNRTGIS